VYRYAVKEGAIAATSKENKMGLLQCGKPVRYAISDNEDLRRAK